MGHQAYKGSHYYAIERMVEELTTQMHYEQEQQRKLVSPATININLTINSKDDINSDNLKQMIKDIIASL